MAYSITILRLGVVNKNCGVKNTIARLRLRGWPWENLTREFYAEKLTRSAQPFALFFALFFPFLPLDLYK
jgi:hypothetical protein